MSYAINVPTTRPAPSTDAATIAGAAGDMRLLKDTSGRYVTEHDMLLKGIVIGDSGVGKSSLLYRFSDGDWNPHYIATIGVDFKTLTFDRKGKIIRMQLWDSAGQERFRTIVRSFYRGVHGVMLVFDLTDAESFDHVRDWVKEAVQFGSADLPFLLVGNKADLADAGHRQVPVEQAQQLAQQLNCEYIEVSAKADANVGAAFAKLTTSCMDRKMRISNTDSGAGAHSLRNPHRRIQLGTDASASSAANPTGTKKICACS